MERGAINGLPVWLKVVDFTGGERTVLKEAPNVDGAVVEPQGLLPDQLKIQFSLIRDGQWIVSSYEAATLELRAALMEGGPFTVQVPMFGEVTGLWLAEPYQVTYFDDQRLRLAEGSATFVAADPQIVLEEDSVARVESALRGLARVIAEDFSGRAPAAGWGDAAIQNLRLLVGWMALAKSAIDTAFEPVNDLAGAIADFADNMESLLNAPQNLVADLMGTGLGLLSLIPSLAQGGDPSRGSAAIGDSSSDKPANVLVDLIGAGVDYDANQPATNAELLGPVASDEDVAELEELAAATSLALTTVCGAAAYCATLLPFATIQSVYNVSEALAPAFSRLLALEGLDYRVYARARQTWKATLAMLSERAAELPRLVRYVVTQDTDVLSLVPSFFEPGSMAEVQAAVDSILDLNGIPDPTDIRAGSIIYYLEGRA